MNNFKQASIKNKKGKEKREKTLAKPMIDTAVADLQQVF